MTTFPPEDRPTAPGGPVNGPQRAAGGPLPPFPPHPAAQPPRRRKVPVWAIVLLAVVLPLVLVGGCVAATLAVTPDTTISEGTGPAEASVAPTEGDPPYDDPSPAEEPSEEPPAAEPEESGPADFKQRITWDDEVAVEVTKIETGRAGEYDFADSGEDVKKGTTFVLFHVRVTNGSAAALDDVYVDAAASYGADGDSAPKLYADTAKTLEGSIPKGKSKTGTYAFVIPKSGWSAVQLEVDLDYDHATAVFAGPIKPTS